MTRRNVEHVRVGDGVLWCDRWLIVRNVRAFATPRGRRVVDLTMESDELPPRIYHYDEGERVVTSRRKNRKRRIAKSVA